MKLIDEVRCASLNFLLAAFVRWDAQARNGLQDSLNFRSHSSEALMPECIPGVLDELDEGHEETPL